MNKRRRWKAKARRRGYTGMVSPLTRSTWPWWRRAQPETRYGIDEAFRSPRESIRVGRVMQIDG